MNRYSCITDDDGNDKIMFGVPKKDLDATSYYPSEAVDILNNQASTIAAQQQVLDQIAAALGVETGDVDGIGREIERLQQDAARYRWLRDGCSEKTGLATNIAKNCYGFEWDAKIDKVLAGGEAV